MAIFSIQMDHNIYQCGKTKHSMAKYCTGKTWSAHKILHKLLLKLEADRSTKMRYILQIYWVPQTIIVLLLSLSHWSILWSKTVAMSLSFVFWMPSQWLCVIFVSSDWPITSPVWFTFCSLCPRRISNFVQDNADICFG